MSSKYDKAIFDYFNKKNELRYGENPHQKGWFSGDLEKVFSQLHGKQVSYNNLLDIDAAIMLMQDFESSPPTFAILKHNNACGFASRSNLKEAYLAALEADPVSAFGGILISNIEIDLETASKINTLFCEVVIAQHLITKSFRVIKKQKK